MWWILSSLVLASALAPWFYQAGKELAETASTNELSSTLEWLGAACGRAGLSRYFSRALTFSAVSLLPLLVWRIRVIRRSGNSVVVGLSPAPWKSAVAQVLLGGVIAGGLLWGTGVMLEGLGAFKLRANPPELGHFLKRTLVSAVAVSLIEEWLFRGLLLGLWLKFTKPLAACVGTSLFFAFIHFLKPPDGTLFADPASPWAGFELLGKVFIHFTNPRFFVTDFATLWAIGMILAWARIRTGALWFSLGLHAGWIVAYKEFTMFYRPISEHSLHPWGVGQTLRSGMYPLLALGLTALICHFALRQFERRGELG